MDRDALYYHFANLGLVLIGFLSIPTIASPFMATILIPGTVGGFLVSWHIKDSRPQHMDTFTGMLSLAAVVIILGGLYDTALTLDNILKIFSTALVWLTLFQSFGLKTGKSYAVLQFISVCLLISSVGLALEGETFYIVLSALFLFIFIFTMRLNLVCEKKRKGSFIFGDQEAIMSLWQQIKVGALMFSFVLMVASLVYPLVPRFENLSLRWVPSSLLGAFEQIPLIKLIREAPKTIKDDEKSKKEQLVDDGTKRREISEGHPREGGLKESVKRFPAKEFDKSVDMFKIESLTVRTDKKGISLDGQCRLEAELRMKDGSSIPATRLVDWKVKGTAEVSINGNGILHPKNQGYIYVSASYVGNFSNDLKIDITKPVGVMIKKKGWFYYSSIGLSWLLVFGMLCFIALIFIKSRRLSELITKDPKEFIKEIYAALCRSFKVHGVFKLDYIAPREFFELVKDLLVSSPESMRLMTENVLEARFSMHEISSEHSHKTLELFHSVKDAVLERKEGKHFWKKILFRLFLLDVLLIGRQK